MVFQYPVRYPFGVEENISLGENTERICFYLDKMGICSREEMTDNQLAELAPWSEKLQSIKNRM